jgi:diguanylate cyclase (GGDEF) domain
MEESKEKKPKPSDTVFLMRTEADNWGMGDDPQGGDQVEMPPILTEEELSEQSVETLVGHCLNLQKTCTQLNGDIKVLTWELKEANDYLLRLARVAQLAHYLNASDLDTIADLATNDLPRYLGCHFAAFYLYDQVKGEFTLYHSTQPIAGAQVISVGRGDGHFLANLFRIREDPFLIEYVHGSYKIDSGSEYLTMYKAPGEWYEVLGDTAIVFPLVSRSQNEEKIVLGGLVLGKPEVRLTEKEAEISMMFVDLLSSSLYNARLVQQLNRMATTDVLTGINNRRQFMSEVEKAIAHTNRNHQPLSLIMLDIDNFKRFNDIYGHLGGDRVLAEMGEILKQSIRKNVDIPARYGGEEFVIVMPYTRIDQALFVCERIRREVEEHMVAFEGQELHVTCSIGVAEYIPGEGYNQLIDRADSALYQAKKAGRNRVAALGSEQLADKRKV